MGNNYHAATPLLMRVKDAHGGRAFLSVFFMLVLVCLLHANTGFAATPKNKVAASQAAKRLSARETAMVNSLLRQAQQAHASGDSERMKSLLFQARQINPNMPTPAWTKKILQSDQPQWPKEQVMQAMRSNPGNTNLLRLEEYVRRNPKDIEAREFLIQAAIAAGAIKVLQRIEVSNKGSTPWLSVLKWLLVILLAAALVWPVYSLIRDLRAS